MLTHFNWQPLPLFSGRALAEILSKARLCFLTISLLRQGRAIAEK